MKELSWYFAEAEKFKQTRSALGRSLQQVDKENESAERRINEEYSTKCSSSTSIFEGRLREIRCEYDRELQRYTNLKQSLSSYMVPIEKWCGTLRPAGYIAQPDRVSENELQQLVRMIEETGFVVWIKRTFQLGGYKSRREMAKELYERVLDSVAYCDLKIGGAQERLREAQQKEQTADRRRQEGYAQELREQRDAQKNKYELERSRARVKLQACSCSPELLAFINEIEQETKCAEATYNAWGTYSPSVSYPSQVLLGNVRIDVLDENGIEQAKTIPLWLPLNQSNLVVLTSSRLDISEKNADSDLRKQLVRQLIARMLMTVPSTECHISVFDTTHKGGSLERLVGVSNVGTNDLNTDVFAEHEECKKRCDYLCKKVETIHKLLEGRQSLYDLNLRNGDTDIPFNWLVDFSFPEDPDRRYLDQLRVLFTNAATCGFSFVFVTNNKGLGALKALAEQTGTGPIHHVDCDTETYTIGAHSFPFITQKAPDKQQLDNFMEAITRFYADSDRIDNRITAIFQRDGIKYLDATDGIEIPIALDSRGRVKTIELSDKSFVHGFISGDTSCGKSTLFHTIILSACTHYHPDDLEIWLVDYKQTEFAIYRNPVPPHVKLIGLSKTQAFTFSFLEKVRDEFERRAEIIMRFQERDLKGYRRHKNEPGYIHLPRVLLIIDEFHEMSQFVRDDQTHKDMLENMLREYRAFGLNCLFADQGFSVGIQGLTTVAKNQISLRIAMRNNQAPDEIKETLEADDALFSESVKQTIRCMSPGDFIMRCYTRDKKTGNVTGVTLEKFKGFLTEADDVRQASTALKALYHNRYTPKQLTYVCTKDQVPWDEEDRLMLDAQEMLRPRSMRLYLGRAATLRPCFGLDLGRQPNENVSILGGRPEQRWEVIASAMKSCQCRPDYKLLVFMAEDSDLELVKGQEIRSLCQSIPDAELMVGLSEWCKKLEELDYCVDAKNQGREMLCIFIGLELMNIEMPKYPNRSGNVSATAPIAINRLPLPWEPTGNTAASTQITNQDFQEEPKEFNALPIIDKLFSFGSRLGIRCMVEVSVYRQLKEISKIKDMCRHKIAFSMSADDCLMYLGNSRLAGQIGGYALYNDGGNTGEQLVPYKF